MKRAITILLFGAMNLAFAAPGISAEAADDSAGGELFRKISGATAGAVEKANRFLSDRTSFPTIFAPPGAGDIDYKMITLTPRDNVNYTMKIIGLDENQKVNADSMQEEAQAELPYKMSP